MAIHRHPDGTVRMSREDAERIVYHVDDGPNIVADWEAEFLDGTMKSLEDDPHWAPTPKQARILLELKERYT